MSSTRTAIRSTLILIAFALLLTVVPTMAQTAAPQPPMQLNSSGQISGEIKTPLFASNILAGLIS